MGSGEPEIFQSREPLQVHEAGVGDLGSNPSTWKQPVRGTRYGRTFAWTFTPPTSGERAARAGRTHERRPSRSARPESACPSDVRARSRDRRREESGGLGGSLPRGSHRSGLAELPHPAPQCQGFAPAGGHAVRRIRGLGRGKRRRIWAYRSQVSPPWFERRESHLNQMRRTCSTKRAIEVELPTMP